MESAQAGSARAAGAAQSSAGEGVHPHMSANALYLGREWNTDHDHDQRVTVSNAELRYATVGRGEPILFIHGTNMADALITPLRFYPALFDDYQIISYYRAGYKGST